tara:strand:- start:60833 stop:61330 length:498 start_codon:yes stop_codon:yes gene_type:complete
MKKLVLLGLFAIFAMGMTQAQNQFRVGAQGGVPVGDADNFTVFAIAVELGYLFEINDSFQAGPSAGVQHFFGETFTNILGDDISRDETFLPISGTARFSPVDNFWFGADLGYAVGLSDGLDGGFYYKPHALYDFGPVAATLGYSGIAGDGITVSAVLFGVEFGFN